MWFLSGEKIETLFFNLINVTLHKSKAGTIKMIKSKNGNSFLWIESNVNVSNSNVNNFKVRSPKTKPITREPVSPINIFFLDEKLYRKKANNILITATDINIKKKNHRLIFLKNMVLKEIVVNIMIKGKCDNWTLR